MHRSKWAKYHSITSSAIDSRLSEILRPSAFAVLRLMLLEQGFSVFMISWKNPDASMEGVSFEDYMTEGPLTASDVVREITGAASVNPVGYCIGGTLLAMTLAYLAARRDDRFGPATFMVSLQDFSEVGDTALFMDEPQIEFMERRMLERGYLDSSDMANMFNLLRSNDLIWNTVINNYLMGNKPPAFDLSNGKGCHWTNETDGAALGTAEAWLAGAQKHDGSWWADWAKWLEARSGRGKPAGAVGSATHPPIGDAPGTYVLEK